ncbi:hypothetical protein ASG68_07625 [Rhizobium sp. Leaf453]|nr:hypothetical protein ASG68_07625 [Rhizobium sp. Leaf453]
MALSDEARAKLVEETRAKQLEDLRLAQEERDRQLFFNRPEAMADFTYWAKMPYWTLEEATALSFGRDPRIVNAGRFVRQNPQPHFVALYGERHSLFVRAKTMGQLWDSTIPSLVLAWAARIKIAFPSDLVDEVKALGIQICDWKTLYDAQSETSAALRLKLEEARQSYATDMQERLDFTSELLASHKQQEADYREIIGQYKEANDELSAKVAKFQTESNGRPDKVFGSRERESLLKLAIGMAMGGYGYNPKSAKNAATSEIETDLATRGISLDADTIRKYLNEAKGLLDGSETE